MLKLGVKVDKSKVLKVNESVSKEIIDLGSTAVFHSNEIKGNGLVNVTYNFNEDKWLTVGDGCGKQAYFSRKGMKKTAIKWGQLKLLISELQFFNKYWNPIEVPKPVCVYVGAAPGTHIKALSKLLPQVTFELYDGREFDASLSELPNVKTHVQYFTEQTAAQYANRSDIYLISDIRSLVYNTEDGDSDEIQLKNEEIVSKDMNMQLSWVQQIKPVKAHLKFRPPYDLPCIKTDTCNYLDGDIYKQAFSPLTSTETRLVTDANMPTINWKFKIYEQMMFYHNNVVREHVRFVNPLTNINENISEELGLLQDYDSVVFTVTVKDYLEKFNIENPTPDQVLSLCKFIIDEVGSGAIDLLKIRSGQRLGLDEE